VIPFVALLLARRRAEARVNLSAGEAHATGLTGAKRRPRDDL
jgi:hypothetical protein